MMKPSATLRSSGSARDHAHYPLSGLAACAPRAALALPAATTPWKGTHRPMPGPHATGRGASGNSMGDERWPRDARTRRPLRSREEHTSVHARTGTTAGATCRFDSARQLTSVAVARSSPSLAYGEKKTFFPEHQGNKSTRTGPRGHTTQASCLLSLPDLGMCPPDLEVGTPVHHVYMLVHHFGGRGFSTALELGS